jgi:hypothetical protein
MEVWVVQSSPRLLYALEGEPVPIVQEAVWAPDLVCTCARNLVPSGLDPRTMQPVASRYDNFESEILGRVDWFTGTNFPEMFASAMCVLVVLNSRDAVV